MGSRLLTLDEEFCATLGDDDSVLGVASTGRLCRIPASVRGLVDEALSKASAAFEVMADVDSESVNDFYECAARRLSDASIHERITAVNDQDVRDAERRGRSTTRLRFSEKMRTDMVEAFLMWRDSAVEPDELLESVEHVGWSVGQWRAPLGVIAFVFEGRPNVFADATGVLKSGNTVVFRIGSDALRTARSIMELVIVPALAESGLPDGAVVLLDSPEHAAGWTLFSDTRVGLAVARGSGEAVAELGSIAQQAGVPVSLHGTGGAWMVVGASADRDRLERCVEHSLDRKVCNTLNVLTLCTVSVDAQLPSVLRGAARAARTRDGSCRLHVTADLKDVVESALSGALDGEGLGDRVEVLVRPESMDLGHEFEWENDPELHLEMVESVDDATRLFNEFSPRFIVSVVSEDQAEMERVWRRSNAPFFGDGFTRWVDGQFALLRPELGLSNWQGGRLLARSGILSGDSAFTVRLRVTQTDSDLHR